MNYKDLDSTKLDYWLMFIDGDITLETLVELLNDYV